MAKIEYHTAIVLATTEEEQHILDEFYGRGGIHGL